MTADPESAVPPVYVIGPLGALRNPHLPDDLDRWGVRWRATGGPAPDDERWLASVTVDQDAARVLHRAPLLRGEIAAAVAHRWAVARAKLDINDWSVFLEDDAELTADFVAICGQISTLRCPDPSVVLLYQGPRVRSRRIRSTHARIRRPLGLPEGAVAYMLNNASVQLYPTTGPLTCVADWPYPWSSWQRFYQVSPGIVTTGAHPSLIGQPREDLWMQVESHSSRFFRLAATTTSVRYLRHRRIYGRWRDYIRLETGKFLHAAAARFPALASDDR